MTPFNNKVHYIWAGGDSIPDNFLHRYQETLEKNPEYQFKIWREEDVLPLLGKFEKLYEKASLFHRLQLGRYTVSSVEGGICADFDIDWKVNFDYLYSLYSDVDLVLPKRRSIYFYDRGKKTTMLDDYIIISEPGAVSTFLDFCINRTERKEDVTEPFSVYALTEWCLDREKTGFLTHEQVYDDENASVAYHHNKRTWNKI
jgi:hypothetical protein